MQATQMHICPLCEEVPALLNRRRYQVRCGCGACGPKMGSEGEAIGRWNSVVHFIQKYRSAGFFEPTPGIA